VSPSTEEIKATCYSWLRAALENLPNRSCYSASLKPKMQKVSGGVYADSAFGYGSFRELLRDAEEDGIVTLTEAAGGDLVVGLTGEVDPDTAIEIGPGTRIRPDLWRAAIDWAPDLIRVFDRTLGRAVMFPQFPRPDRPDSWDEQRAKVAGDSNRFVPITPISEADTIATMKSFAEGCEEKVGKRLLDALNEDNPASKFTREIRIIPGLAQKWHLVRTRQVAEYLSSWSIENKVSIQFLERYPRRIGESLHAGPAVSAGNRLPTVFDTEGIREAVIAAVRVMPMADVLRLAIPVEFLVGR
jgi:Uncharacterised protein family (UPF0158)